MSFRNIRPAGQNIPVTGADSRLVPRVDDYVTQDSSSSSSKRRRVPASVTRNACVSCKKARAKCDGKTPCSRCLVKQEAKSCSYEAHSKHAKEELLKEIKERREKDALTEQILGALSNEHQVPGILFRLKNEESYEGIVDWLEHPTSASSPRKSQYSTAYASSDHDMSDFPTQWTSVTSDSAVLDHLLQLYFAWVHPVHTLFSENHFVDSYKKHLLHFCSSSLVNAMCAMACHLHTRVENDPIDFEQLGISFSNAVRQNIDADDNSLTTVQTFAVLFLVDCARGKGLRASSYLKVAIAGMSNIETLDIMDFTIVVGHTSRGLQDLNVEWAQVTFQPPNTYNPILDGLESADAAFDEAQWIFYRHTDDESLALPGLFATTNREKVKLSIIMNDVTTLLYGRRNRPIEPRQIIGQYIKLVGWRDALPASISDFESSSPQALPHVLFLLIMYSSSMVQLLCPLLALNGFVSRAVSSVVWTHAQQGLLLLSRHYRLLYTCRYQCVIQMFAVLHLCDTIARFFPSKPSEPTNHGIEAMKFGIEALMQSREGFPIAGPLQELLRRAADEFAIALPRDVGGLMLAHGNLASLQAKSFGIDDFVDACTRPTYQAPIVDIHTALSPNFAADWALAEPTGGFPAVPDGDEMVFGELRAERGAGQVGSSAEKGPQSLMQISSLLNDG